MSGRACTTLFAATLAAGCATVPLARTPGPTPGRLDIRALAILPASPHACPGQTIGARYVATLGDGSRVSLARGDLSLLVRRGEAAEPRSDGSWQTNNQPLASAVSGFQLSAVLASDTSVRADTTIVPTYECIHTSLELAASDQFHPTAAHVRLGTFATPFYDSVVVAVLENGDGAPIVTLLGPGQMRSGAIKLYAPGKAGRPGKAGNRGADGQACANGENGEDGERGEPGQPGGSVDSSCRTSRRGSQTSSRSRTPEVAEVRADPVARVDAPQPHRGKAEARARAEQAAPAGWESPD